MGKSSLVNMLTGRAALAMVSKTPGAPARRGGLPAPRVWARCACGLPLWKPTHLPRPLQLPPRHAMSCHSMPHLPTPTYLPTCLPTTGKTRCINHFLINGAWYLVDLPGYG